MIWGEVLLPSAPSWFEPTDLTTWLAAFSAAHPRVNYRRRRAGEDYEVVTTGKGFPHNDATRQKISTSKKGQPLSATHRERLSAAAYRRGPLGPRPPEVGRKISAAKKGIPTTAAHRAAVSEGLKRYYAENPGPRPADPRRGRAISAAHRAAISAGMRRASGEA